MVCPRSWGTPDPRSETRGVRDVDGIKEDRVKGNTVEELDRGRT